MKYFTIYLVLFLVAIYSTKLMADSFVPAVSIAEYQQQLEDIEELAMLGY